MGKAPVFCFFNNEKRGIIVNHQLTTTSGLGFQARAQAEQNVLKGTNLDPFHSITTFFNQFKGRPTIVPILVCQGQLLIVKSTKSGSWGFPQGGIKTSDGTLMFAALREAREELGLSENLLNISKRKLLGEYVNPVPRDRNLGYDSKHMVLAVLPVLRLDFVKLNDENCEFAWVRSGEEMIEKIGESINARKVKLQATVEAVNKLWEENFLPWSCERQKAFSFS